MKTDRVDESMAQLLEAAAPEMSAGWEARAMERLTAARPARGISRRLVIAAVGVAALVGLGFVPIPMGSAPGALERALAQAEQATTVHAVTRAWGEYGGDEYEYVIDEWLSEKGFWRAESWHNGTPETFHLAVGGWDLTRHTSPQGYTGKAMEIFDPTLLQPATLYDRSYLDRELELVRWFARRQIAIPDIKVTERREAALWGGAVNVVEARYASEVDQVSGFGGFYDRGTQVLVVAEIDPASNRLLSVCEYKLEGGRWEQTYQAAYEWDVEIPEDLKQVELPKGTELTLYPWWERRVEQVLGQAETRDWTVTVHAIDIQRNGDVVLSLSRVGTPQSQMPSVYNTAPPLVVEAVGSSGERYVQQDGYSCYNARHSGYWTTTLRPDNPNPRPRTMTLTIWPYRHEPCEDQSVTFRNIRLPARQNTDDLFAAETEVIQY